MAIAMHVFLPKYKYSTMKINLNLCNEQSLNVEDLVACSEYLDVIKTYQTEFYNSMPLKYEKSPL